MHRWLKDLRQVERREQALHELSHMRKPLEDLAPMLWHSFGTMVVLIQEIVHVYPQLSPPPTLTPASSNRACNSLSLLQLVAAHKETRALFLKAQIPMLLYPLLNTVSKDKSFEFMRLSALGVIGAMVKFDDPNVVSFLLETEIIPLCLRIMETGTELSKTVATFIMQKLLLDEMGLAYVCATAPRFYAVSSVLSKMVTSLNMEHDPSARLLKNLVRCFHRLSENPKAREALRKCLPGCLHYSHPADHDHHAQARSASFAQCLQQDAGTLRWLNLLWRNLSE